MALDSLSLSVIAKKLNEEMEGAVISKPIFLGNCAYGFPYFRREDGNRGVFIFTLEPTNPYCCYSKDRFERVEDNSPFFNSLKKLISATVTSVEKYPAERILTVHLQADKSDISETNDGYDLILELFPNRPNCYLIAYPYGKIISLYKEHIDLEKNIFLTRKAAYEYPPKRTELPLNLSECEDARPYLPNATLRRLKKCVEQGKDLSTALKNMVNSSDIFIISKDILSYSFNDADAKKVEIKDIYSHFVVDQKEFARQNKVAELIQLIEKSLKFAIKKKSNLENDLQTAKERMAYLEYGQIIYLYQGEIKKGDTKLERDGYSIQLNPLYNVQQNAAYYFKKYTKAKSAIAILAKLIENTEDEIDYLTKKKTEAVDGTARDIMELKSELLSQGYIKVKQGRNTIYKVSKKRSYEPHYLYFDEFKIGFGMNGLQNEELTFSRAKKTDLFLHVKDYPGSHVVIFDAVDNDEALLLAGELALFLSHLDSGSVMVTPVKNVKKNPNKLGLVNILRYNTIEIRGIREESKLLFKKELKRE